MPGYSVAGVQEQGGLLPWHKAEMRLIQSRHYWVATTWPDGRPHLTTVWGAWNQDAFWFSAGRSSRKSRNLQARPRCTVGTEDPEHPIVFDGKAELITNPALIAIFLNRINTKYRTSYSLEFMNPEQKACYRVRPEVAIGVEEHNFTGSATRWRFET